VALAITGIGTLHEEAASFLRAGHLSPADLARLRAEGIVGETIGRFFDVQGNFAPFAINDRVIGIDLDDLRAIPRVVAVARGLPKAQSILGALRGKLMTVLTTDDLTARAVLELEGWRADSRLAQSTHNG
jgi:DNA-binding transcriptional regulator LsrR (DeoR family)